MSYKTETNLPPLQARILYVNPVSKEVGLSLLPHIVNMTLPSPVPLIGQVWSCCCSHAIPALIHQPGLNLMHTILPLQLFQLNCIGCVSFDGGSICTCPMHGPRIPAGYKHALFECRHETEQAFYSLLTNQNAFFPLKRMD